MIGAAFALAGFIAAAPPDAADPGVRIAAAVAAEQGLQGPLDGGWTLIDAAGQSLYRLELVDPAGGHGPLTGAWSDTGGASGVIDLAWRSGRTLHLEFAPARGPPIALRLIEVAPGRWSGGMVAGIPGRLYLSRTQPLSDARKR